MSKPPIVVWKKPEACEKIRLRFDTTGLCETFHEFVQQMAGLPRPRLLPRSGSDLIPDYPIKRRQKGVHIRHFSCRLSTLFGNRTSLVDRFLIDVLAVNEPSGFTCGLRLGRQRLIFHSFLHQNALVARASRRAPYHI